MPRRPEVGEYYENEGKGPAVASGFRWIPADALLLTVECPATRGNR